MGILNRFLLFLFALVSVAAGGALVVVAARLLPQQEWLSLVEQYAGRPECLAGLAIYLIVGLHLLVSSLIFRSRFRRSSFRKRMTAGGRTRLQSRRSGRKQSRKPMMIPYRLCRLSGT